MSRVSGTSKKFLMNKQRPYDCTCLSWHSALQVAVPHAEHILAVFFPASVLPHGHLAYSQSSSVRYPALNLSFSSFLEGSMALKISKPQSCEWC